MGTLRSGVRALSGLFHPRNAGGRYLHPCHDFFLGAGFTTQSSYSRISPREQLWTRIMPFEKRASGPSLDHPISPIPALRRQYPPQHHPYCGMIAPRPLQSPPPSSDDLARHSRVSPTGRSRSITRQLFTRTGGAILLGEATDRPPCAAS